MGYMGFGMKKEVYTRRAKTPFTKLKKVYGQELQKRTSTIQRTTPQKITEFEREKIRSAIKKRIRLNRIKTVLVVVLVPFLVAGVVLLYKYLDNSYYTNGQPKHSVSTSPNGRRIHYTYYRNGEIHIETQFDPQGKKSLEIYRNDQGEVIQQKNY